MKNEEMKDSSIETTPGSGNDLPRVQRDDAAITPQQKANEPKSVNESSTPPSGPSVGESKPPVSAKKLEANIKNARKSTGPRTEPGKAKAAANSYQHGFFAKHLFHTAEQAAKDKSDYLTAANGVCNHYRPVGFMENLWAEKITTEAIRLARLVGYEQEVMMAWRSPFGEPAADKILRYQTTANRRMTEAIEELERLQTKRKAEEAASENPLRPEANDAPDEPETPTPMVGAQSDEQSTDEAAGELDSGTSAVKAVSYSAPPESCGTNPPNTLAGLVAEALDDKDSDIY